MRPFTLYNTATRNIETFTPRTPGEVTIYACGLTVQGPPHIGHIRGAIVFDVIRRWLTYLGYSVQMIQNFTDVDDKIIRKANEENVTPAEVAQRYAQLYLSVLDRLHITPVQYCRVTEEIDAIIDMVATLVERGHAYVVEGDVYFDVSSFPAYGKLSGRSVDEVRAGYRIEVDERKNDPADFALWKSAKPGEPSWPSPWGEGRPGWHIECSAMSLKYLGSGFDIHAGGSDLVFPHHENEIAQSEAASGQPFATYWMHWGAVRLGKEKMSKSLGNFFTAEEILSEFDADILRLFLLSTAYRSPVEFSRERMAESRTAWGRVKHAIAESMRQLGDAGADAPPIGDWVERFEQAMCSDFNTPGALAVLFDLVSECNRLRSAGDLQGLRAAVATLLHLGGLLGFHQMLPAETQADDQTVKQLVELAIRWRQAARQRKDWTTSDAIRDDLKSIGIIIEDTPDGTVWRMDAL